LTVVKLIAKIGKTITKNGSSMDLIQSDRAPHHEASTGANLGANLGAMLEGYDCPAILVSANYEILAYNNQYRDAFGELALEQKPNCFNVSHGYQVPCDQAGESCPLQAAQETQRKARALHIHQTPQGKEHVDVEMLPIFGNNRELLFFVELLRPVPLASGSIADQQMVGKSSAFSKLLSTISRVGKSDVSVMLKGESGTGKELAARAIHMSSARSEHPLVTLECAGLTDSLFESELFGHVKGAFTSAVKDKAGKFEAANGGTIFLDEIGDMSLSAQSKVLRALQEHKIQRVGSERDLVVDVRVIAATNKNLRKEIENNNFREDLFHRLAVIEIDVPSLNKRLSDIPLLVDHFLKDIAKDSDNELKTMDKDAINQLKEYDWSGNVRELRNVVERLIILSDNNKITKKDVIKYSNK